MMTPPFSYQQSNFMPPPKASFTLQNPQNPIQPTTEQHPIFNNNPLQPIPLKEAALFVATGSSLIGFYKGCASILRSEKPLKPMKAVLKLLWKTLDTLMSWGMFTIMLIQLWNFYLERKRNKALGIPTPYPTMQDALKEAKKNTQLAWQGIKSMVSPGSSSQ